MGDFKSCSLHGKPFPHNLIDLDQQDVAKLFIEQTQEIEGKKTKLQLYIGRADTEGMDVCATCMNEKIISMLESMGVPFSWKHTIWEKQTMTKKDGTTYERNIPTAFTVDEIALQIREAKKNK